MFFAEESGDIYYTNNNGVNFTEEEYDFFTQLYWHGYQKMMTQDDFDEFVGNGLINERVDKVTVYDDTVFPMGTTHITSSKSLSMATVCLSNCKVSVTLIWLASPTIRSYDVIGAYLYDAMNDVDKSV